MEHTESDSASSSLPNGGGDCITATQQDPQLAPSSNHGTDDPQPSDLYQTAQDGSLSAELQSKLDLKGLEGVGEEGGEIGDKVSNFGQVGGGVDDGGVTNGDDEVVNGGDEGFKGGGADGDNWGWETNSWEEENVNVGLVDGDYDGLVNGYVDADGGDDVDGVENREEKSGGGRAQHQYPWRPDAQDCAFYMKTGNCKFGINCKFNHPINRRKNQAVKERPAEREEEQAERPGQTECKYYLRSGGCKFGKDCKYNHTKGKDLTTEEVAELNFLGLPIRLGKRECPYYMRTGSCKFGANCKFNHPDPTTVGGSESSPGYSNGGSDPSSRYSNGRSNTSSGYSNGGSISLHGVSQQSVSTWSSPRTVNETSPFVPMMLSPPSPDWNAYQAPTYLSERSMHPPPPYVMNNPVIETNVYIHPQKRIQLDDFPERPGEPECSYFLKTGDCKFKSNCKFHHPKNRIATLPPCNLNDKGLPLRPDKNACMHYTRYGLCKFGPACKYDHPINPVPPTGVEVDGMGGNGGAVQ
ncbi:zinc finger CCCH domain-containing protein 43-like isoform X2 [Arachis stenosperma]|uniref:zinc finger CCCH domain-containing protein 43-like isoform X2 n=1 Tax=Arachis stenosperma TaxID=217475 RepID=UPI0025AB9152|nr:zinc finger CCCH domain-containing protein 43-like isoform X2 [Arachis stenosperma]